ncbi:MAG: hypothetical protein D6687_02880 [Acidobacteria bacterium]|nr:MAG: hypothetical protein D6687_02880 [Acidobacteriota bacterium]GIU83111.1 MAG: hypothetical protein KatS3mg006_2175 [Pyrinomonadaceae bacterium]
MELSLERLSKWLRVTIWLGATALLLLPLIAMRFSDEVKWGPLDFAFAYVLLFSVAFPLDLLLRKRRPIAYQLGACLALVSAFLLIWINAAVGIIGSEKNPANLMYFGVIGAGILGVVFARFKSKGMMRSLITVASLFVLIAVSVLAFDLGTKEFSDKIKALVLNGFFATSFATSALLFWMVSRKEVASYH